jgi:hypothetical protein
MASIITGTLTLASVVVSTTPITMPVRMAGASAGHKLFVIIRVMVSRVGKRVSGQTVDFFFHARIVTLEETGKEGTEMLIRWSSKEIQ